ncbi:hypothetical protein GCM10027053_53760 [Intrasporangium mesophilum]
MAAAWCEACEACEAVGTTPAALRGTVSASAASTSPMTETENVKRRRRRREGEDVLWSSIIDVTITVTFLRRGTRSGSAVTAAVG